MSKERKQLIKKLDDKIRDEILEESPLCVFTGQPATEVHHYIKGRTNLKYRWDKRNLMSISRNPHTDIEKGIIKYEEVKGKALYWDIISMEELDEIENDNSINKIFTHELNDLLTKYKE